MILRRRWSPAVLLLLTALLASDAWAARITKGRPNDPNANLNAFRRLGDVTLVAERNAAPDAGVKSGPVGTKDAPVDGRDGMPHEGPFVETNAERSRKKSKEIGDEELAPSMPVSTVGKDIPVSNDGVMDDAGRLGPVEGTRGTEGGVSGKSVSKLADKKPDPPKESPPLPHSETEKITDKMKAELSNIMDGGEDKKILAVSVSSASSSPRLILCRNQLTFPRSLTISPFPRNLPHRKTKLWSRLPIHLHHQKQRRSKKRAQSSNRYILSSSPSP